MQVYCDSAIVMRQDAILARHILTEPFMHAIFEELDYQVTPLGEISLRKRSEPKLNNTLVYEVKLNDDFLMSSLFTEAEEQLAHLALAKLADRQALDIVVGGLGLGYTSLTALQTPNVQRVRTIEVMSPVISWHQQGLLPIGDVLATDSRSVLVNADFFAGATAPTAGFFDEVRVDALLLDIDHSPSHWLNSSNQDYYNPEALAATAAKIRSGGVFGLWSNEPVDAAVLDLLDKVFIQTQAHDVYFANPYTQGQSLNSVYLGVVA